MAERILIVDDDAGIAAALAIRLRASGFDTVTAADGEAGVAAARAHAPAVVLLDIRMPKLDGFGVCRALRRDPATAGTPVIFLSANVEEAARQQAIDSGGTAFLAKPYAHQDVIETIQRVLAAAAA